MHSDRLQTLLARFPNARLLVLGDFFLDKYLLLDAALTEPSLETGLDAYQVVGKRLSPGAAGTVVANLCALGAGSVQVLGYRGADGEGTELCAGLRRLGVDPAGLLIDEAGCTPTYIKPMLQEPAGERELHRLDIQNRRPPAPALEAELLKRLRALLPTVDAVIVADQVTRRNCGSVTDGVRREICTLAAAHPAVTCLVDSRAHVGEFDSLWVKANRSEVARAFGLAPDVDLPLTELARLCQAWSTRVARPVFCTLAADGLLMAADTVTHLPAIPQSGPIDVCGAGDSTLAGIALALCAGATPAEAAQVGMLVASLTVQQLGTTGTATPAEVLARFTDAGDGLVAQAVG